MSKSLGNYVGIMEPPDAMYGKLMSISDSLMRDYFVLCTDLRLPEIDELLAKAEAGAVNPKDVKRRLAREIVALYHGVEAGEAADVDALARAAMSGSNHNQIRGGSGRKRCAISGWDGCRTRGAAGGADRDRRNRARRNRQTGAPSRH
jgi:hypothetical protein